MIDLPPPPQLWMPARPAIIRPGELVKPLAAFGGLVAPPFMKPAAAGITKTYVGFSVSDTPSFTMPAAGVMVVTCFGRAIANRTVNSITIDGVESLKVAHSGYVATSGLAAKSVAAGSRAVSITWSGALSYEGVHCWLLEGVASATPYSTNSAGSHSNSQTVTLNIPANGIAIYHAGHLNNVSMNWSTATEASQDEGNNTSGHSAASKETATLLTSHAETCTFGTTSNTSACGASFSAA